MPSATIAPAASSPATSIPAPSRNATPAAAPPPRATDDEILGIVSPRKNPTRNPAQLEFDFDAADAVDNADGSRTAGVPPAPLFSAQEENSKTPARGRRYENHSADDAAPASSANNANATGRPTDVADANATAAEPAHLRAAFDANPELRTAWHDAGAYRESFATPEAAREATALLADVNHMDALFFSRRPEDHAALARAIANLDPAAFASLANAMTEFARSANPQTANVAHLFRGEASTADAGRQGSTGAENQIADAWQPSQISSVGARHAVPERDAWHSAAYSPRSVSPHALRNEGSEASAASSFGPAQPVRADAQSRNLSSADHAAQFAANDAAAQNQNRRQDASATAANDAQLAFLNCHERRRRRRRRCRDRIAGRAAAARRRVLNEWTSTIVSAAHERRTRQRTAERRVDIAGSGGAGNDGRRSMSPRDLDYARLTDADILNL